MCVCEGGCIAKPLQLLSAIVYVHTIKYYHIYFSIVHDSFVHVHVYMYDVYMLNYMYDVYMLNYIG